MCCDQAHCCCAFHSGADQKVPLLLGLCQAHIAKPVFIALSRASYPFLILTRVSYIYCVPQEGIVPKICKPFLDKICILSKPPSPQCMHYFGPDPTLDLWKTKALLEIRFPLPSLSCALSPANCAGPLHRFVYSHSTRPLSRSANPGHSCCQFAADP